MSLLRRYNIDLVVANLLLGFNYSVVISLLDTHFSVGELFAMQLLAGGLIALPLIFMVGGWRTMAWGDILPIVIFSLANIYGWSWLMLMGAAHTSAIDMATIATLSPALTLIVAHLKHTRRVTPLRTLGVVASLLGALMLVTDHIRATPSRGNIFTLGAVAVMATVTVMAKPILLKVGVKRYITIYLLSGGISSLLWSTSVWRKVSGAGFSFSVAGELLWFLTLGSVVPLFLLYSGAKILSPLRSALYRYFQPLIAIIVIYARGEEGLDHANLVAIAMLLAGGALVATGGRG
ncbi:MAG: DMT family transporter [Rikenellaceae bacterium]